MATTPDLIDRLANEARPVCRLRHPAVRALAWLAVAALLVAVIASIAGIRPGLLRAFDDPRFAVGRLAALATAITATLAAFQLSLPDRSSRWLWLPLPFAALWLGTMGVGCVADWLVEGPSGLRFGHSADCFVAILATSVPLGALLLVMVRHAGPVRPVSTALAAGLALAAVGEGGLTLYHDVNASLMDLLIHLAAVAVVIALALSGSRALYRAVAPR